MLKRDVDIGKEYAFASNQPPLAGTLKKGSKISVAWRKSAVVYIQFSTAVMDEQLKDFSVKDPERR